MGKTRTNDTHADHTASAPSTRPKEGTTQTRRQHKQTQPQQRRRTPGPRRHTHESKCTHRGQTQLPHPPNQTPSNTKIHAARTARRPNECSTSLGGCGGRNSRKQPMHAAVRGRGNAPRPRGPAGATPTISTTHTAHVQARRHSHLHLNHRSTATVLKRARWAPIRRHTPAPLPNCSAGCAATTSQGRERHTVARGGTISTEESTIARTGQRARNRHGAEVPESELPESGSLNCPSPNYPSRNCPSRNCPSRISTSTCGR